MNDSTSARTHVRSVRLQNDAPVARQRRRAVVGDLQEDVRHGPPTSASVDGKTVLSRVFIDAKVR
jgi:hypothetical protein